MATDTGYSWPLGGDSYLNAVGDHVEAILQATENLTSVTWTIDGGIDISTYNYSYESGVVHPIQAPITHGNIYESDRDAIDFLLNGDARVHSVSATCVYVDNTTGTSNVLSVQVEKPMLTFLKISTQEHFLLLITLIICQIL